MATANIVMRVKVKWWLKLLWPLWVIQVYLLKQSPFIPKCALEVVKD
jgi:hypothetical protein